MSGSSRLIAMLLAVIMTASLLCVPALAESAEDPYAALKEGTGYVALGDSFTRGYGATADGTWKDEIYKNEVDAGGGLITYDCRNVTDSVPNRIAEHFGLYSPDDICDTDAKMWPIAHDAVSVAYMLDLIGIEDDFSDEAFVEGFSTMRRRYNADLMYFGDPESRNFNGAGNYGQTGSVKSIRSLLGDARLITVQLGQTDVLFRALQLGLRDYDLDDAANLPAAAKNVVKILYEKFEYLKRAFPLLLDYIKENCENAEVVIIGTFNPLQNVMLSDEVLLPVGSAFNVITGLMNAFYESCADKYGFTFVDISNIETYTTDEDVSVSEMLSMELGGEEWSLRTHPTPEGYAQMARMIVSAAEKDMELTPAMPATYIRIDMGKHAKVGYVLLGDDPVYGWYVKDHVLTVPCRSAGAKLLTVAVDNDDGTVSLINYRLQYGSGGYTAHRVFMTSDLFGAVGTMLKNFFTAVFDLFRGIFGLFAG